MLSDNIKKYRKERNITQEKLATELNVVRQTVSKWEKGLSVPDTENLTKMAEILNVSVNELLDTANLEIKNTANMTDDINMQLQNINNMLKQRRAFANKLKKAVIVIIIILAVGAIYPKWNEIWYEFGQNLYGITH